MDRLRELLKSAETRRAEKITAYVDGQLPENERRQFEKDMAGDAALRTEVADLRRVKTQLRSVPRVKVPMNFTLDPKLYSKPAPAYDAMAYPILRGATAFAALLFVFMFGLNLVTGGGAASETAAIPQSVAFDIADDAADSTDSMEMAEMVVEESAEFETLAIEDEESASDTAPSAAMPLPTATLPTIAARTGELGAENADESANSGNFTMSGAETDDAEFEVMEEAANSAMEIASEAAADSLELAPTISTEPTLVPQAAPVQQLEPPPTVEVGPSAAEVVPGESETASTDINEAYSVPAQRNWNSVLIAVSGLLFAGLLVATLLIHRRL